MALITRLCRLYASSVRRKLKVSPMLSNRVLSQLETNTRRDMTNLGKKQTDFCPRTMKLNLKTNGSRVNQSQCWRIRNVNYFGILQSRQIRKQNTEGQALQLLLKERENTKSSTYCSSRSNIEVEELKKITKHKT